MRVPILVSGELDAFGLDLESDELAITAVEVRLAEVSSSADGDSVVLVADKTTSISLAVGDAEAPGWEYTSRVELGFTGGELTGIRYLSAGALMPWDDLAFMADSVDDPVVDRPRTRALDSWLIDGGGPATLSPAQKLTVAKYALLYDGEPNPDYYLFDNDCTNFASQALKYGGWATVGTGGRSEETANYVWGYWGFSILPWEKITPYTWRVADNLFRFTINDGRGYVLGKFTNASLLANQSLLEPGDLIFTHWEGDSNKDHVMVVVSKVNGIVRISQHTPEREGIPLAESRDKAIAQGKIDAVWWFVRT